MSLHVLAYNLKRVISILGIAKTMKAMKLAGRVSALARSSTSGGTFNGPDSSHRHFVPFSPKAWYWMRDFGNELLGKAAPGSPDVARSHTASLLCRRSQKQDDGQQRVVSRG